jgi:hypothetical protein
VALYLQERREKRAAGGALTGSGLAPTAVAGLKLWVGIETLAGTPDGAGVGVWADQSGNGQDLTQANEAQQPIYRQSIDGAPAVDCNFGGRLASIGNVLVTDQFVVLAVGRPTVTDEVDAVGTGGTDSGDLLLMCYGGVVRGHIWRSDGELTVVDGVTLVDTGTFGIFEEEVDESLLTVRLNGIDEGSAELANDPAGQSRGIYFGTRGDGHSWLGYFRALVVYEGNPGAVALAGVREYLQTRYIGP